MGASKNHRKAAEDFGMPMGPIELADQVGLDICLHVAEMLKAAIPTCPTRRNGSRTRSPGRTRQERPAKVYDWKDATRSNRMTRRCRRR